MVDLSDEMLMAYADERLDPVSREVVEAALRDRPEYRAKVEKFRQTLAPVRRAFGAGPASDHRAGLIEQIRHGDSGSMHVVARRPRPTRHSQFLRQHRPTAIAASIALLTGMGLGWMLQSKEIFTRRAQDVIAFGDRGLAAQGPLQVLLEATKSGTTIVGDGGGQVWRLKASFTFQAYGGTFCRRYEMVNDRGSRFGGYACRSGAGTWLIQAHARSEAIQGKNGFVPSAGQSDSGLDAAMDAVRNGDVLEAAQESTLIENGWRNSGR